MHCFQSFHSGSSLPSRLAYGAVEKPKDRPRANATELPNILDLPDAPQSPVPLDLQLARAGVETKKGLKVAQEGLETELDRVNRASHDYEARIQGMSQEEARAFGGEMRALQGNPDALRALILQKMGPVEGARGDREKMMAFQMALIGVEMRTGRAGKVNGLASETTVNDYYKAIDKWWDNTGVGATPQERAEWMKNAKEGEIEGARESTLSKIQENPEAFAQLVAKVEKEVNEGKADDARRSIQAFAGGNVDTWSVMGFQKAVGAKPDGVPGARTVAAAKKYKESLDRGA